MDIATRMKSYEEDQRFPKGAVIIRIDGKNFHSWVKHAGAKKPFDKYVHTCMVNATRRTALHMQGFKIAFTQSDESTFLLTNLGENEGAWFDYKAQKIASVTASMFTTNFNEEWLQCWEIIQGYRRVPAWFDARAFSIPIEDAANNFVWRQQDWSRNSVQMLGHHHISHKVMQGLSSERVKEFLKSDYNVDWNDLTDWEKYGTFLQKKEVGFLTRPERLDYDEINRVTGLDKYMEID